MFMKKILIVLACVLGLTAQAQTFKSEVIRNEQGDITCVRTTKDGVLMVETLFKDGQETLRLRQKNGVMKESVNTMRCATCENEMMEAEKNSATPHAKNAHKAKTHGAPTLTEGRYSPSMNKPICYNDGVIRTYRLALPVDYSYFAGYFNSDPDQVRSMWNQKMTLCITSFTKQILLRYQPRRLSSLQRLHRSRLSWRGHLLTLTERRTTILTLLQLERTPSGSLLATVTGLAQRTMQ